MLTRNEVEQLSRSLDEPEWLLDERLYAFSVFEEFVAKDNSLLDKYGKLYKKYIGSKFRKSSAETSAGFGVVTIHDLLYNELRAEFAKEAFLNKEHKPEKNAEISFILAFFNDCNFYFAEAGSKCELRNSINGGISLDFFFLEDECDGILVRTVADGLKLEEYNFGNNCKLESMVINISSTASYMSCTNIIGKQSLVNSYSASFGSGRVEITNKLAGEKSQAYDVELFVQKDSSNFSLNSILHHAGISTKGNIFVKGIVKDSANVKLDGMIKIDPAGAGSESFLDQHAILMNPGCHAEANPELEIENNDVSSRHSASVSQLDDEKIFYALSRGMNEDEAKDLIVDGFLNSAVEKIQNEKLKEEVLALVEKYK